MWIVTGIIMVLLLVVVILGNNLPSRYDYLDVLSFSEWKLGRQVAKDLLKLKGFPVNYGSLYTSMRQLEEEGLDEHRDSEDEDGRLREFRRVPGRRRPQRTEASEKEGQEPPDGQTI